MLCCSPLKLGFANAVVAEVLALLGLAQYIHAKRTGNKLIESYQWYVKLLK